MSTKSLQLFKGSSEKPRHNQLSVDTSPKISFSSDGCQRGSHLQRLNRILECHHDAGMERWSDMHLTEKTCIYTPYRQYIHMMYL